MSDFEIYESCPSRDELESGECQYNGCENLATHATMFFDPKEYVPYCKSHAWDMLGEAGGKSVRSI